MEVRLLLCVCMLGTSAVSVTRDVQRQLNILEERYDLDTSQFRNDIRQLWKSVDKLDTCCTDKVVTPYVQPTSQPVRPPVDELTFNTKQHAILVQNALKDEKRFARDTFKALKDSIGSVRNETADTFKKLETKSSLEMNKITEEVTQKLEICTAEIKKMTRAIDEQGKLLAGLSQSVLHTRSLPVSSNELDISYPRSCIDIARRGMSTGTYLLYNRQRQPFKAYCNINEALGKGYTVISPETYYPMDINELYNVESYVTLVHRRTDGRQYTTTISQLDSYSSRPISVQFNAHVGHNGIVNNGMGPYIYVGLTPRSMNKVKTEQGYNANNQSVTFTNCDGNPNGYFALLFNHEKNGESKKFSSGVHRKWIDLAVSLDQKSKLPDKYFSEFELHFGGCGAFAQTKNFGDVAGAALALHFQITCLAPEEVAMATRQYTKSEGKDVSVGTVVTYQCIHGNSNHVFGDLQRTCQSNGAWSGHAPVCA